MWYDFCGFYCLGNDDRGVHDNEKSLNEPDNFLNVDRVKQVICCAFSGCQRSGSGKKLSGADSERDSLNRSSSGTPSVANRSHVIAAVVEGRGYAKGEIGMAYMDLYHPELYLVQFSDSAAYSKLRIKLQAINPVELILPDTAVDKGGNMLALFYCLRDEFRRMQITPVSRKMFNESRGIEAISRLKTPDCVTVDKDLNGKYYCLSCAAALVEYIESIQNMIYAPKSVRVIYKGSEKTMLFDPSTAKNLELIMSLYGDTNIEKSLFGVLDYTYTLGGARMLRSSILQPSADLSLINRRLDAAEEISACSDGYSVLRSLISRMLDVDQLVSLCAHLNKDESERAADYKITQVICLKHTLELVEPLRCALDPFQSELLVNLRQLLRDDRFQAISNQIATTLNDETSYQKGALKMRNQKCFAVKSNLNGLLDISRRTYSEMVNDVQELTSDIVSEYHLPLKCSYSSGRGFFFQLNLREAKDLSEIPPILISVVQRGSMITCTTRDLIKLNDRINEVVTEILSMSNIIVTELLATIRVSITCLYNLTEVISSLDMLLSLVTASMRFHWVRPDFTDSIAIQQGRHPIMERFTNQVFIPNDVYAGPDSSFVIVTGPNMGGKSTYLKMVAVLQIMAQIGSFVPANYASFRLCDQLFSRIEHNDNPEANCSSFVVEMKDINYILKNVSPASLVIIDELGRNTSVEEGMGICYAVSEELIESKALVFLATHYLDLAHLDCLYPTVENYHFERIFDPQDDRICLNHILKRGPYRGPCYGLELAEMAAFPPQVISRAKELLAQLNDKRTQTVKETAEQIKQRAVMRLGHRLIQASRFSEMNIEDLFRYLLQLKRRYYEDLAPHQ